MKTRREISEFLIDLIEHTSLSVNDIEAEFYAFFIDVHSEILETVWAEVISKFPELYKNGNQKS